MLWMSWSTIDFHNFHNFNLLTNDRDPNSMQLHEFANYKIDIQTHPLALFESSLVLPLINIKLGQINFIEKSISFLIWWPLQPLNNYCIGLFWLNNRNRQCNNSKYYCRSFHLCVSAFYRLFMFFYDVAYIDITQIDISIRRYYIASQSYKSAFVRNVFFYIGF